MKISVEALIEAPISEVWTRWTTPDDVVQWNAASDDWHTVAATNDLQVGGGFSYRMEAKDGSSGFDFEAKHTAVDLYQRIESVMPDGREILVLFAEEANGVRVTEVFDTDGQNPEDLQRNGWQAILDNFKRHVEAS